MADLVKKLQRLGWSAQPVDICWMACDKAGHHREIGIVGETPIMEIVLCRDHIEELEATSQGGYSQAAYPMSADADDDWWPWRDAETGEFPSFPEGFTFDF